MIIESNMSDQSINQSFDEALTCLALAVHRHMHGERRLIDWLIDREQNRHNSVNFYSSGRKLSLLCAQDVQRNILTPTFSKSGGVGGGGVKKLQVTDFYRVAARTLFLFTSIVSQHNRNHYCSLQAMTIINIGCPRLHEEVIAARNGSKSFLLDLDNRLAQFFPHNAFAQYNMFNNHFFSETGRDDFQSYVAASSSKDLFIVMDPPFAGRVEVLAHNLRQLFSDIGGPCSVAWIFPYFLEKHIAREFPDFTMLDYKVEYDNHRKFKDAGKGETRGSPVRIFTNVTPSSVPHPADEGYRFCQECDRFSARENVHCLSCGLCPSKDGKTWRHCRTCAKCVKSDWNHCKKCQRCHAWNCMAKKEIITGGNGHANKKRKRSWSALDFTGMDGNHFEIDSSWLRA